MIKCKKCRKDLIHGNSIVTSHGGPVFGLNDDNSCESQVWYVKDEDLMEDSVQWIRSQIDSEDWVKGKLVCPHVACGARLGSFNFITRLKCSCRQHLVPPVHLIKKRVDIPYYIPLNSDAGIHQSSEIAEAPDSDADEFEEEEKAREELTIDRDIVLA